jgi:hypothetical protein
MNPNELGFFCAHDCSASRRSRPKAEPSCSRFTAGMKRARHKGMKAAGEITDADTVLVRQCELAPTNHRT